MRYFNSNVSLRICLFALVMIGTYCAAQSVTLSRQLCVMSYNIRTASAQDAFSWETRRPLVRNLLAKYNADIIGTQEAMFSQVKDILADYPNYDMIGLGREGGSRGEFMAVFYEKFRLEPLEFDHFWLSDTPDVIGSTSWGNTNRRMVTWVRFRDRLTTKEFYLVNTHFDHEVDRARKRSAELLVEKLAEFQNDLPVIVTGDFNDIAEDSPAYSILTTDGGLRDSWKTAGERKGEGLNTYNGYSADLQNEGQRIDWILVRGPLRVTAVEISDYAEEGKYPSDHFPVIAWISFNR